MTGFDVADRLKSDERTRNIPILFLTAVATGLEEIYRAYKMGAVDYLIKPLNIDAVRSKVAVLAGLFRQRQEIELRDRLLREAEQREHAVRIAELRAASDERYRKLIEGFDHTFAWSADAEARRLSFVSRRAQELLGFPDEAFQREGFLLERVHPDDRELTRRAIAGAVAELGDHTVNHRLLAVDGSARWFHTVVSADADRETHRVELHGMSTDVTDLKAAEERQQRLARENARLYEHAAQVAQAREELLQVVSHDLRAPLASVLIGLAHARSALAGGQEAAQVSAVLESAERAARSMKRLVTDLVDLELVETGRLSMIRRRNDVAAMVADAFALVEPLARAKAIDLRVDADLVRGTRIVCDFDRVLQVLSNLLDNAIKFSPREGTVVLAVRPEDGAVRFAVSDQGPGIDPAQLPHIFDRLWQAKEWARYGLGLGLSIARGLVQAHEGRIWAESEPGKGATFFFTLPFGESRGIAASAGH
jgi:PAS domain S-box-containing protein